MRVWTVGPAAGPANIVEIDRPVPVPNGTEVVVRTGAVSLNYRDLLVVSGRYQRRMAVGAVPCSDAAGEVIAIGPAVSRWHVGDRVMSTFAPAWQTGALSRAGIQSTLGAGLNDGVLAEAFVLPEDGLVGIPRGYTFEQAATLPCAALTAWHALFEETSLDALASVLTLGTGGVSVFAVQFARAAGCRVIATSGHDAKIDTLQGLGVTAVINYRSEPLWGDRVREMAGGDGVDLIVEVGGTGTLDQSLRAVRPGGTVCLIGNVAEAAPVNLMPILMRNIRLQGIVVGSRAMCERMVAGIERWQISPVIDRVFGFDEAPAALAYFAGQHHVGKVVISAEPARTS